MPEKIKNTKDVPTNAHNEDIRPPSNARRPLVIMYAQTPDAARRMTIFIIFTVVFPTPMSAAMPESTSNSIKVIIAEAATPITILNQILFLKSDILFYRSRIKVCTQPSYYALRKFLPAQSYIRPTAKDFACAKVNAKNEKRVKKAAESTNNRLIGRLIYFKF